MEKLLEALGFIVDDTNKSKVEAAKKILGENFVAKHRYDEKSEEAKKAQESLKERDKQIETLKTFEGDKTQLEKRVKELQEANKEAEKNYKKSLVEEKIRNAVKRELADKVHDESVALGLIDVSKVELDDAGNIKLGFKEQLESLKKDKGYLFKTENKNTATDTKANKFKATGTPPADGSDNQPSDAVAFAKMLAGNIKAAQTTSDSGAAHYFGNGK